MTFDEAADEMEKLLWQALKLEGIFVASACLFAILEIWGIFAALALLAVLGPLWLCAAALLFLLVAVEEDKP